MKSLIIVLVVFSLATTAAYSQQLDCKKFRNGTYKMTTDVGVFIIRRHGAMQVESKEGEAEKHRFTVAWIDDCTYSLKPSEAYLKKNHDLPKDATMIVTITQIKENSYMQTTTTNFADLKVSAEMVKIAD
jgi:hypothetical protein